MTTGTPTHASGFNPRARLLAPIAGAGVVIALFLLLVPTAPTQTVSETVRSVRAVALHRSEVPGVADGGLIGPWWISAAELDPVDGRLLDFKLESGPMRLAASSARIIVDAERDSFSFELEDVVYLHVPKERDRSSEGGLLEMARFVLGPVACEVDIVEGDRVAGGASALADGAREPITAP